MAGKKRTPEKTIVPAKITVCKNGPLRVSGSVPLLDLEIAEDKAGFAHHWSEKRRYPAQEEYILCRCGLTRNSPFCDKSHEKAGFVGAFPSPSKDPYIKGAELIEGPELALADNKKLCVHARFCLRSGGIRNLIRDSEVAEAHDIAIEEAGDCPSGRLVIFSREKRKLIEPEFEPSIAVTENPSQNEHGPLWIRGKIPIEDPNGALFEQRNRVTLCRCGKSENKPFCDGSHLKEKQ